MEENLLKKLGLRIRHLREQQGLSQTELANQIGKDQPSLNRLERGRVNPTVNYLNEVANGLNVELTEFFRFDNNSNVISPLPEND